MSVLEVIFRLFGYSTCSSSQRTDYSNSSKKSRFGQKNPRRAPVFDDPIYLIHCCMLCQGLRKALINHPMYSCELLKDLDNLEAHDIGNYQANKDQIQQR